MHVRAYSRLAVPVLTVFLCATLRGSPFDQDPPAVPQMERALHLLEADLRAAPVPTAWSRAHRLIATSQPADLDLLTTALRPPTHDVPVPHFFDAPDDEERVRADKSESHDGQLALALAVRAPSIPLARVNVRTIRNALAGERGRHTYRAHMETLQAFLASPGRPAADRRSEILRRRRIADAELSWFFEAAAHDLAARGEPSLEWTDGDGCRMSLEELADLQHRLAKHAIDVDDTPLAERGTHAVGAFVRVALMAAALPRQWAGIARLRGEAVDLTVRLLHRHARAPVAAEEAMAAAHVLELVACRPVAVALGVRPAPRPTEATARERDFDRLTGEVLTAATQLDGFAFKVHSAHALQLLIQLGRARAGDPMEEFRACATI